MKKTKVTFYNEGDGILAVFMEGKKMSGLYTCFSINAKMHTCTKEYFNKLQLATPEEYLQLMLELIREFKYDLDVFNVRTAGWLGAAIKDGDVVWLDGIRLESETLKPIGKRLRFQVLTIRSETEYHVTTLNVAGT